jgi:hypothetical protein
MFDLLTGSQIAFGARSTPMSFQEHEMFPAAQGFARKRVAVVKLSRLVAVFLLFASSQFALAQTTDRPPGTVAARALACAPCHSAMNNCPTPRNC